MDTSALLAGWTKHLDERIYCLHTEYPQRVCPEVAEMVEQYDAHWDALKALLHNDSPEMGHLWELECLKLPMLQASAEVMYRLGYQEAILTVLDALMSLSRQGVGVITPLAIKEARDEAFTEDAEHFLQKHWRIVTRETAAGGV